MVPMVALVVAIVSAWAFGAALASTDSDLLSHCDRYRQFDAGIAEDLLPWQDDEGISETLMDQTISARTILKRHPGVALCILGGQLYVINGEEQVINKLYEWQSDNVIVYVHAIKRLVERWGTALPDVEFVIETIDSPNQDLNGPQATIAEANADGAGGVWSHPHGRMPVMRHCKTAGSLDITVPIFHFYTMMYDDDYLNTSYSLDGERPWEARWPRAFAAGVSYHRNQNLPGTRKQWDGKREGQEVAHVREAFSNYLSEELRHPNITYSNGTMPIEEWAKNKMVMHVDGITCSSRLWQLLALGSVVLREESGYYAFYDKLLRKFVHYVPFWSHRPREVVWAFNWVQANDEAARAVATQGRQFARDWLNREAIECFWGLLLRQYARLLKFTPGKRGGGGAGVEGGKAGGVRDLELTPVEEWLEQQEGKVPHWSPHQVKERGKRLNLLPPKHQRRW